MSRDHRSATPSPSRPRAASPLYTTCLHCHLDLGTNEALDHFPVGRRLAFDQLRGRLWVVCHHCARWNLSPLEERWEVIEACERLYRDTPKRVATEQIGLARVRDRLELVRIGKPVFPEYAGWRYGSRFLRRHSSTTLATGAGAVAVLAGVAAVTSPAAVVVGGGAATWLAWQAVRLATRRATDKKTIGTVQLHDGRVEVLHVHRARRARLAAGPAGGWTLALPEFPGKLIRSTVEDAPTDHERLHSVDPFTDTLLFDLVAPELAAETLRRIMPTVNATGGDQPTVTEAVRLHERWGGRITESVAALLAFQGQSLALAEEPHLSLALEMSVNEDQERRWLETELHLLDASWKEAERLAAISDSLTLPAWIEARMERLKAGQSEQG